MKGPVSNYVVVVPHTHWDREWYLPFEAFRMRLAKLFDSLCGILETEPDAFFHMDGQTVVLEDFEAIRGRSDRLRALVGKGRIAIGPWYAQPDEFLPSGEAIIRNLQVGMKIASEFGKPLLVGYLPDMFGHMGQMPQIFRGFGINRAVVFRGAPKEVTKCGFVWRAPDGSEVFTAFLPMGYMNGFGLPHQPDKLRGRFMITRALMDRFIEGPAWLMMAGTDHQQPQRGLAKVLNDTFGDAPGWEVKLGSITDYFERLEVESVAKPVVTGELRSVHYAPILPATGSTRVYLKKRDFALSSLLERYAEPISSWAWALGGADRRDFTEYAWKLMLKNHAHDSICGTSIDEVHREMETRFNRVETVGRRILGEAATELGAMIEIPHGRKWLGVWRPCGGAESGGIPIIAEMDGKPAGSSALEAPDGTQIPLQILDVLEGPKLIGGATAPVFVADVALGFLFQEEEMLGGYIVSAESKKEGETLAVTIGIGASPAGFNMEKARLEIEKDIASGGVNALKLTIQKLPRVRVAAVTEKLPPYSINAFNIARLKHKPETNPHADDDVIESARWRVVANPDGTLTIHDRRNDLTFKNALKFVDEGDRGDEYNFEPVEGEIPITEPIRAHSKKLYNGPVAAGMRIKANYRIPAGLDKSLKSRSKSNVPVEIVTDVVVYKDVNWVDFRASFLNRACDHRLRVLFEAPFDTDELLCETAFEVARRKAKVTPVPRKPNLADPLTLLIGPETEVGFGPHRGFAALESPLGNAGMALLNRGLLEIEAIRGEEGAALALTLLRGVRTLSRDDLTLRFGHAGPPILTPDAQCLGPQVCEFAFTSYKGTWRDVNLPALAHSWRHPTFMFRLPSNGDDKHGGIQPGDPLISIDNPAVEIRALQPSPDGSKALCARIYNSTDKPQKAKLKFNACVRSFSETDFMGVKTGDRHLKREQESVVLELPPARIITLKLEFY